MATEWPQSLKAFRRYFGKQYIRGGGNALYLQRIFGYTRLDMTRRYVEANEDDLLLAHQTLSPLKRLKAMKAKTSHVRKERIEEK